METKERLYELDWLRVIAFFLLIFFHTGMFFVPWDFHFKNSQTSELFELWMTPLNQFRLPLLFIISGIGSYFVLSHRTIGGFFKERSVRLLIPLTFGMFVIVPPQMYFEYQFKGANYSSYFEFYKKVLEFIPYPKGSFSWHHLWYIIYIFVYSVAALPLLKYLRSNSSERVKKSMLDFFSKRNMIYLAVLPPLVVYYSLAWQFPTTHALWGDWYNLTYSFIFFLYGIIIISVKGLWDIIEQQRKVSLVIAAIPFSFLWLFVWGPTFEIMPEEGITFFIIYGALKNIFLISWVFTIFGYSRKFFVKSNKLLIYSTEAVYPLYILHQTVMITLGYYIIQMQLSILVKFVLVVVSTYGGSLLVYELLIKRIGFMRVLFGMKTKA
ncbi:MAG: acyltransferase family protein [Melioribacteraceae bacterium]